MPIGLSDAELVAMNADLHQCAIPTLLRRRDAMEPERMASDEFDSEEFQYGSLLVAAAPRGQAPKRLLNMYDAPERQEYIRLRAEEIRQDRAGRFNGSQPLPIFERPTTAAAFVAHEAAKRWRAEAAIRAKRAAMSPEEAAGDEFLVAAIEHEQRKVMAVPTDQCNPRQTFEEVLNSPERHAYVQRRAEEIRQERAG